MRFLSIFLFLTAFCNAPKDALQAVFSEKNTSQIEVGAAQIQDYLPLLQRKKVALCVNHTAMLGETHLLDTLLYLGVSVQKVFAPEHGFRGAADAGEQVKDGKDLRSGLPIFSLYGKKKRPAKTDLEGIDVLIFDIQDAGARFYTYISTMYYLLDACGEYGVEMLVLDRPNPNGHYVDGPILEEKYKSFVGIAPLPIVHGCTVGELARMFVGEGWLTQKQPPKLQVVPCKNYGHQMPYELPIPPSPNLPNQRSIYLYPSLCLFEGTTLSVGRGTSKQFQVFGHPDLPAFNTQFTPHPNEGSKYPPQEGKTCKGRDLSLQPASDFYTEKRLNLSYLLEAHAAMPNKGDFFLDTDFFEKLAGTRELRQQIISGMDEAAIRATWAEGLEKYKVIREKYLIYED